jgi:hypothetical protein
VSAVSLGMTEMLAHRFRYMFSIFIFFRVHSFSASDDRRSVGTHVSCFPGPGAVAVLRFCCCASLSSCLFCLAKNEHHGS